MGKLDILKLLEADLAEEYSVKSNIFLQINGKNIIAHGDAKLCIEYNELLCALCIFYLAESGKINSDSYLCDYIGEYSHAHEIKLSELLSSSCGIPDYTYHNAEAKSVQEICECINDFPLDMRIKYSKTRLEFMRIVIEKVTGGDIASSIMRLLLEPLEISAECDEGRMIFDFADFVKLAKKCIYDNTLLSDEHWQSIFSFNSDGEGIGCKNDNGIICFDFNCDESIVRVWVDHASEMFMACDVKGDMKESYLRTLLDNIEILTVYPKSPEIAVYDRSNAGRATRISPEFFQLAYVCDAKTALCYAYANKNAESYVLCDGYRVVGICILSVDEIKGEGCIEMLMTDKKYQHKGYGKILVDAAVKILAEKGYEKVSIAVHKDNIAALRLYEKCGFSVCLEQPDYFILNNY